MTKHVQELLEAARNIVLTPEEKELQRRSFAYGNTVIENQRITREMVDHAADEISTDEISALLMGSYRKSEIR